MNSSKNLIWQVVVAVGLIGLAVAWRVYNHELMLAPNLELVTGAALVASVFLHRYFALIVPLGAMFVSDAIIGNTDVAIFVWSAFAVIGLVGLLLKRWQGEAKKLILGSAGVGIGGAVFFFLWTNLGVWLLGDGSFYPHTWQGLMTCYAMALPFFRATLISGMVIAPAAVGAALVVRRLAVARSKRLAIR